MLPPAIANLKFTSYALEQWAKRENEAEQHDSEAFQKALVDEVYTTHAFMKILQERVNRLELALDVIHSTVQGKVNEIKRPGDGETFTAP